MKIKYYILLLLIPLMACGKTEVNSNKTDNVHAVKAKLEKEFSKSGMEIQSVQSSPLQGIYEVVIKGNEIFYVDASAQYIFYGNIFDIKNKRNLTEERQEALNIVDFSKLPLDNAIKEVRGTGKNILVVFSDPDCPYCKKLEHELEKISDITIYTFLMPILGLHPDAYKKSVQIWCQEDRTQAWIDFMRHDKMIPRVADCKNPIQKTTRLGESLGFTGTPSIIFPNGKIQMGFTPADKLKQAIMNNQK